MLLYATHITNLTDARYFAAREFQFLGFNLEEGTEGYLDPMYMKAIREWVEGPAILGEFRQASAAYVREAVDFFGLDGMTVSAVHHLDALNTFQGKTALLYLDIPPTSWESACRQAAPFVTHFIIPVDMATYSRSRDLIGAICRQYSVLLHPDLEPGLIPELIQATEATGLSVAGGSEEQVGVKSFDELDTLFDLLGIS